MIDPAGTSSQGADAAEGLIVGAVYSGDSLRAALSLEAPPAAPDLLELRVDHFAAHPEALAALTGQTRRGLIVTVRHPDEGGAGNLDLASRRALYERFLPHARYADIELRSLADLAAQAGQARLTAGGLIASYHDFAGMPALSHLRELAGRAADAGAALCKMAVTVTAPRDVAVLLELLGTETRLPLAVMGMGPLGRLSRLAAATLGSRLNYGYLGEVAQVPGQWPVEVLRARLAELLPSHPKRSS